MDPPPVIYCILHTKRRANRQLIVRQSLSVSILCGAFAGANQHSNPLTEPGNGFTKTAIFGAKGCARLQRGTGERGDPTHDQLLILNEQQGRKVSTTFATTRTVTCRFRLLGTAKNLNK